MDVKTTSCGRQNNVVCVLGIECYLIHQSLQQEIVTNILKLYNKRLDNEQLQKLVDKDGSSNPLWLTLACEELRVYGNFERLSEKIESLPDDLIK